MPSSPNSLPTTLDWRTSLLFPVATKEARRDIVVGGLAVALLLVFGWVLNLGARLDVVHRLYRGDAPYFRGMKPLRHTFRRGCVSAATIFSYLAPANASWLLAYWLAVGKEWRLPVSWGDVQVTPAVIAASAAGLICFVLGVFTLPGCMTVYACEEDPRVLRHPLQAFRRAWKHRRMYGKAWMIALCSIALSFLGLFVFVIGFFVASVWAWEVVGYAFTVAMYSDAKREAIET